MKRKLILLNLLLVGLTAAAGWKLREQYLADRQLTQKVRTNSVKTLPPPLTTAMPKPDPFSGATYAEVAQKNLFAKDRNPNVIIDVPPPKPVKKMPPLPIVFGVMGLPSGMTAIMAEKLGARSRGVLVGETVGDFKVVELTRETATFEWDGKRITKKLEELSERASAPAGTAAAAPDAALASTNAANIASVPGAAPVAPAPAKQVTVGDNMKACQPGDTSPAGTVVDGYHKVLEATPFGNACRWVK